MQARCQNTQSRIKAIFLLMVPENEAEIRWLHDPPVLDSLPFTDIIRKY